MRLPGMAVLFLAWIIAGVPPAPASAHPGGLDSSGCHTNRKTGDHHCHRGAAAARSIRHLRSLSGGDAFRNCAEARAAGAAPVRAGDPGYSPRLDRDHDGIGCE